MELRDIPRTGHNELTFTGDETTVLDDTESSARFS